MYINIKDTFTVNNAGASEGTPCYFELRCFCKDDLDLKINNETLSQTVELSRSATGKWSTILVPDTLPVRQGDIISIEPLIPLKSLYLQGVTIYNFDPRVGNQEAAI